MASKKFSLLLALICFTAMSAFAQVKIGTYYDSSQIPKKRMPQHSEFLNGTYNFPAKPRDQWEIGIKGGLLQVNGDIPAKIISPGFGLHVRKAFGYVFSMRLEYMNGFAQGLNWKRTSFLPAASSGNPWAVAGYNSSYYNNYKAKIQDLSLQGVVSFNNIRFHKSKTGINFYGFAGIGGTVYNTKVNARDGNGTYQTAFRSIAGDVYKDRKNTLKALKKVLDKTYESAAENGGTTRPELFGGTLTSSVSLGIGLALKINNRVNLALEDRITFVRDDLLDGQRWAEKGDLSPHFDTYNFMSAGLNINLGSKAVEPLWWMNPLDYAYSEIRTPRLMRLPKPVLPDSDGDGVTDQFDQEQTPAGCPVDSHGVSRDTDGDGVPDCKDKELITPTNCQPVDADGVGKCPCPTCENCPDLCKGGTIVEKTCAEKMGSLPSISFKAGSNKLSDDGKAVLATAAATMRNNPGCNVVVVGYCSSNKKEQQLSWDHVNAVINHLVDKEGISKDRLIFNYAQEGGDCNTVDLHAASDGETGPNRVDPPHPNLMKKN
jgi:outer membrane protein OmpA-like peptidoglycan-associated protein